MDRKIHTKASLLLESAIKESIIRKDGNGNPALDKRRGSGRIDALSASIIAVGLGSRPAKKGKRTAKDYILHELYDKEAIDA